MKLFKFTGLCLFLGLDLLYAGSGVRIGGGLNMSSVIVNEDLEYNVVEESWKRVGFNAGVAYEYAVNNFFSVSPGLAIETRGEQMQIYYLSTNITYNLMYIQIPILAQVNFSAGGPDVFSVFLGPDIGFKISAKAETEKFYTDTGVVMDTTMDMEDISACDAGLTIGLGYEFNIKDHGAVYFRPSYFLGLVDVREPDTDELKHRNIKFELGYKINL
jgi:hypothetical protein